ncbi:MAG TPA: hypothetical protein DCQ33_01925, partial [Nitrospira sp.]|nr:hypothetical protein [Nitrospira sp.]
WNQRRRLSVEGTPTEAATADPAPVPARWELTRGLTLRPWQHSCVDAWLGAGKRGVVKVVTGAGKTVLALAIAERLQQTEDCDLRIAVIVPTLVLLSQWLEEFRQHSNLPPDAVGVIGGGSAGGFSDR